MDAVLDDSERHRIEAAVRAAEAATSGEIVVMVAPRAGSYRSLPLAAALVLALAAPWPLLLLTDHAVGRLLLAQLAVALAVLLAFRLSADRLLLVPERLRRSRAREAASRAFWTRGLDRTEGRTGVLIYVALAERYAEVVADRGVAERVGEAAWRGTIDRLVGAIGAGDLAGGLERAVAEVGTILAEHAPPGRAGDELPNAVIVG